MLFKDNSSLPKKDYSQYFYGWSLEMPKTPKLSVTCISFTNEVGNIYQIQLASNGHFKLPTKTNSL